LASLSLWLIFKTCSSRLRSRYIVIPLHPNL